MLTSTLTLLLTPCSIGNDAWTRDLEWAGQKGFRAAPLEDWYEDLFASPSSSSLPSPASSSAWSFVQTLAAQTGRQLTMALALANVLPIGLPVPEEVVGVAGDGKGEGKKGYGRRAGSFRNYGNFTFAIVDDAGHFVPKGELFFLDKVS